MDNSQKNRRIAKNSLLLSIRLLITMAISLYTSRVVLYVLGVEDYGLYNVVGGFVALFSALTDSLGRAFSRYSTVAIAKRDTDLQKKVFSANINILIVLALLILFFCEIIGYWYFGNVINVPNNRRDILNIVFQFSLLSFVFNLCRVPCTSLLIAHEHSGAYAIFSIMDALIKLVIVLLLQYASSDKLVFYVGLLAAASFFCIVYNSVYCRIKFEGFSYVRVSERSLYKEMFGFASWSFAGIASRIVNTQGTTLIINKFCGLIVNAAGAITSQVDASLRQFVTNLAIAVNPQIVKSYTVEDYEYMKRLIFFSSKCFSFIVLYYAVPFSFEASTILRLWLGQVPEYSVSLLQLTFLSTVFLMMANPLEEAAQATGRIRKFQINTGICLLIMLPIELIILGAGFRVEFVYALIALGNLFVLVIQLISIHELVHIQIKNFITNVVLRVVITLAMSCVIPFVIIRNMDQTLLRLLISCIISIISTTICIYIIGFSKQERKMVISLIKSFISKK